MADGVLGRPAPPRGRQWLRVAVVAAAADLQRHRRRGAGLRAGRRACRYVTEPRELADADLVVLPGTKATVATWRWLRAAGLADAVARTRAAGRPVLGICGGYQMLGPRDRRRRGVEARRRGAGWGCCDVEIAFAPTRPRHRPTGTALGRAGARLRDPPRPGRPRRRPAADRWTAAEGAGAARVRHALARRCSRTTGSAGRSCAGSPRRPGGTGSRSRRTPRSPRERDAPAGPARRPGRGAPRHRRAGTCHRSRCAAGSAGRSRPVWQARA